MHRLFAFTLITLLSSTSITANEIETLPLALQDRSMEMVGAGAFKRFGFHIYDASYWRSDRNTQALKIIYRKNIKNERLIKSTLSEWSKIGLVAKDQAESWATELGLIWPNVTPGVSLISVVDDSSTRFFNGNGKLLGQIDDPEFGLRFLDIWLHPETSAGRLRKKLLKGSS